MDLKSKYVGLMLLLGCHACAHGTLEAPAAPKLSNLNAPTTLGNDDVFDMKVFGEESLSGTHRIGSDGSVALPLAGRLKLCGLTPAEAAEAIAEKLAAYMHHPYVSIFVTEYNSKKIYVFGEVRNPGTFSYSPGMSIVQAITLAGGFEKLADKTGTLVNRMVEGKEQRLRVSVTAIGEGRRQNFELRPGDMIYVPETFF